MLEDPDRDARDVGLQMLHEFMKYGDVECSAVPFFPSPSTRQHSGIDFNRYVPETSWNAGAFRSGRSPCRTAVSNGIIGPWRVLTFICEVLV
jgi:hypothetical protein